ncbi:grasp-with-spasm system A modified peptide [uncultured Chryseobacterium sp.]|uniref:grasp-with-spasm system A modified peptide n=1 Tax=uncultured Chryseobacterium sp. TaxID=259322 RepID=UPI0025D1EBF6|nr:grasp-with-spasm system A modified peptide [uncultured Chryseobacterium sp.]
MKKLTGMKKNFSSLENRRLKNLQFITGGAASSRNSPSGYKDANGDNVADTDYYSDDTAGNWKYKGRHSLEVGQLEGSFDTN